MVLTPHVYKSNRKGFLKNEKLEAFIAMKFIFLYLASRQFSLISPNDKIDAFLKDKNGGGEFKTVINYGEYETFRYIY